MELVVSAVVGELVNRFMSFLFNKYKSEEQLEKKVRMLQDLVVRAHMIVEEAEARYITNSKMLLQLKKLVEVMYQGYLVLDTNRYTTVNEVSSSFMLPVIGGVRVGKKTLIAHVCNNEKIRSQFSSVLHLNGENIWTMEHDAAPVIPAPAGKSLLVVHFASDVDDEVWLKFYSSAAKQMGRGSKIVIVSRVRMLSRLGTVQPICLNNLSHQEYSYLFKVLAFGSTNPEEHHPQLASVAQYLAEALRGSLVTANLYAHLLRKNQNVGAWLCILQKYRKVVENNMSIFGVHPKNLMDKEHPIYITSLVPLSSSPILRLMPPQREIDASKGRLPKVLLGDLIVGSAVLPKKEFQVVVWESRIPPYKRFVHLATYCDDEPVVSSQHHTASPSMKRRRLDK
ncbi:uncharacterized protein LOC8083594 [Sorghum bicolor]|uniref:uncharacterized protein LOC8083594 n=1 Tax=Sorghum bicolor TaxID=4558 RepID=UPI00081ABB42|nr:uncharacterized protein LOC8083594 [Sorghum bicolor]|eukprot:XP_021306584.1 uncharacterized protein LOC8083594 [Sorghum bicolor]